jgi:hypothetical protein
LVSLFGLRDLCIDLARVFHGTVAGESALAPPSSATRSSLLVLLVQQLVSVMFGAR